MIIQPEKGTRDVTDLFYEAERKRIEMLNNEFFHDVELTEVDCLEDGRILLKLGMVRKCGNEVYEKSDVA